MQIDSPPLAAKGGKAAGGSGWLDALLRDVGKIPGWLPPADMWTLADVAMQAQPGTWVEVGSWQGRSSVLLGCILRHLHKGQVLRCIDPHEGIRAHENTGELVQEDPTYDAWYKNVAAFGLTNVCRPHVGTVASFPLPHRIPFAFIDGLHDFDSVTRDATTLLQAMDAGCIMAFHDYAPEWPGVVNAVDSLSGGGGPLHFLYRMHNIAVCEAK